MASPCRACIRNRSWQPLLKSTEDVIGEEYEKDLLNVGAAPLRLADVSALGFERSFSNADDHTLIIRPRNLLEFAAVRTLVAILLILLIPVSLSAWGAKGHAMINQVAIDAAASKLPEFMNGARDQIIFNANEPDRWREEGRTPLNIAQEVDHFLDSEEWGPIPTIPSDRFAFLQQLIGRKGDLRIGYLPYAIIENYGRLVNAFRNWRNAKIPSDREASRANAVYVAGVLGHYVGDGSQPLHTTIHYNGWVATAPNPRNFTRDNGIHSRYESAYVNAAIDISKVRPNVQAPQRLPSVWNSIKQYLARTFADLEPLYELEKTGEFNPEKPRSKGTDFIAAELSRAGTMLASLWYTAWLESGEPPLRAPNAK
jgi:hypothetical protein